MFTEPFPDAFGRTFSVLCISLFFSVRLLQSKPEVARKALSDNSLLKNIDFSEKFLGEEYVAEGKIPCWGGEFLSDLKVKAVENFP